MVARIENNEVFTLAPGKSRTVQLSILMNSASAVVGALTGIDPNSLGGKMAAGLANAMAAGSSSAYRYHVHAKADVEGVALDPSQEQQLQILAPGQVGGTFGVRL